MGAESLKYINSLHRGSSWQQSVLLSFSAAACLAPVDFSPENTTDSKCRLQELTVRLADAREDHQRRTFAHMREPPSLLDFTCSGISRSGFCQPDLAGRVLTSCDEAYLRGMPANCGLCVSPCFCPVFSAKFKHTRLINESLVKIFVPCDASLPARRTRSAN